MINIAVTKISSLLGKHPFKTSSDTVKDLQNRKRGKGIRCETTVEKKLRQTSFYKWFTNARVITNRMRKISRSIVNKTCKELNVKFNRPYNYFAKERGIIQEPLCIRKFEHFYKTEVSDQQRKVFKQLENYRIVGAIDGLCMIDEQLTIIEVKCRSCVLKKTPIWEIIQLKVYCYLMRLPGLLLEFQNDGIKLTNISLEEATESFEKDYEPKLSKIINEILLPKESDEGK